MGIANDFLDYISTDLPIDLDYLYRMEQHDITLSISPNTLRSIIVFLDIKAVAYLNLEKGTSHIKYYKRNYIPILESEEGINVRKLLMREDILTDNLKLQLAFSNEPPYIAGNQEFYANFEKWLYQNVTFNMDSFNATIEKVKKDIEKQIYKNESIYKETLP